MTEFCPIALLDKFYTLGRDHIVAQSKCSQFRPIALTQYLHSCIFNAVIGQVDLPEVFPWAVD